MRKLWYHILKNAGFLHCWDKSDGGMGGREGSGNLQQPRSVRPFSVRVCVCVCVLVINNVRGLPGGLRHWTATDTIHAAASELKP